MAQRLTLPRKINPNSIQPVTCTVGFPQIGDINQSITTAETRRCRGTFRCDWPVAYTRTLPTSHATLTCDIQQSLPFGLAASLCIGAARLKEASLRWLSDIRHLPWNGWQPASAPRRDQARQRGQQTFSIRMFRAYQHFAGWSLLHCLTCIEHHEIVAHF